MKELDDILKLYVDKGMKPYLQNPFIQDACLYASNGHVLIRIAKGYFNTDRYKEQSYPKSSGLFDSFPLNASISLSDIEKELSKIELIDEKIIVGEDIKCKQCDGDGIVEWEYERWTKDLDCPVCDGDGYCETKTEKPTGKQIINPDDAILIIDRYFKVRYVNVLIETMKFFEVENIELKYSGAFSSQIIFDINENVSVLIMPYLKNLN